MPQTYDPPKRATYLPVKERSLVYSVEVLTMRELFGRTEYEIRSLDHPDSGTTWVNQKYLTFTEEA